jgi:hypothetical protein
VRPELKIGICGEHGGDPASVHFCHSAGMDYVSCSPYRVPIARLAAAQAALTEKPKAKTGHPAPTDRNRRILVATGRRPSDKRVAKPGKPVAAPPCPAGPRGLALAKRSAAAKAAAKKPAKSGRKPAPKKTGPSKPRGKGKKKR